MPFSATIATLVLSRKYINTLRVRFCERTSEVISSIRRWTCGSNSLVNLSTRTGFRPTASKFRYSLRKIRRAFLNSEFNFGHRTSASVSCGSCEKFYQVFWRSWIIQYNSMSDDLANIQFLILNKFEIDPRYCAYLSPFHFMDILL